MHNATAGCSWHFKFFLWNDFTLHFINSNADTVQKFKTLINHFINVSNLILVFITCKNMILFVSLHYCVRLCKLLFLIIQSSFVSWIMLCPGLWCMFICLAFVPSYICFRQGSVRLYPVFPRRYISICYVTLFQILVYKFCGI